MRKIELLVVMAITIAAWNSSRVLGQTESSRDGQPDLTDKQRLLTAALETHSSVKSRGAEHTAEILTEIIDNRGVSLAFQLFNSIPTLSQ